MKELEHTTGTITREARDLREQLERDRRDARAFDQAMSDCNTERDFWKSAAERALRMWDAAQNTVDDVNVIVQELALYADAMIECCNGPIDDRRLLELRAGLFSYVKRAAELVGDSAPEEV